MMKKSFLSILLLVVVQIVSLARIPSPSNPTCDITVMSLSVREAEQDKGLNIAWENRLPAITACLQSDNPSILLVQHAEWQQVEALDKVLGAYSRVSVPNRAEPFSSVYTAIYFKTEDFSKVNEGHFWLSETPDEVSRGWNGCSNPRDATWVILKDSFSEQEFLVVNVVNERAVKCLRHALPLIQNRIYDICKYEIPVIVGGVFWADSSDSLLQNMHRDYHDAVIDCKSRDSVKNYHDFGSNSDNKIMADHIFYRGFNGVRYETITAEFAGIKYMSDHYPIQAVLEF